MQKNNFIPVVYKNVRLNFGLRCLPTLLMLALFKILVLDTEGDSETFKALKLLIYQLSYMDNCVVACNNSTELLPAYHALENIFAPYKFGLQQFYTNDLSL